MATEKARLKYLILGAGPSGLSFAHALKQRGEESFLVIEKEQYPGGLCRSDDVDGAPLDIGGGHFLDIKKKNVLDFLFKFMPESEWQRHDRISKIKLRGSEIDYPLEANLWQLPMDDQIDFLESIAQAGCVRGLSEPKSFERWISWKLGRLIADEYMLPYNKKIFSLNLKQLGTYWLYKLPDVSFRETLQSCLQKKFCGKMPAHAQFLYPKKHGYGEVWRRMGEALGDRLLLNTPVSEIDIQRKLINGCLHAEKIITTIPWSCWPEVALLPEPIKLQISKLRYSSVDVDYFPENIDSDAHWIYDPDERLRYHRILCRSNFCKGSSGHWTETNSKRSGPKSGWRYCNEFAYPLNTNQKQQAVSTILEWARSKDIYGLGRWGIWEHMNSDVAVESATNFANSFFNEVNG